MEGDEEDEEEDSEEEVIRQGRRVRNVGRLLWSALMVVSTKCAVERNTSMVQNRKSRHEVCPAITFTLLTSIPRLLLFRVYWFAIISHRREAYLLMLQLAKKRKKEKKKNLDLSYQRIPDAVNVCFMGVFYQERVRN